MPQAIKNIPVTFLKRIGLLYANFSIVEVKEKHIPHLLINRNILKSIA